jgi:hypothetical protein
MDQLYEGQAYKQIHPMDTHCLAAPLSVHWHGRCSISRSRQDDASDSQLNTASRMNVNTVDSNLWTFISSEGYPRAPNGKLHN